MSQILAPIKQEHISLEFALALSMGLALMADVDAVCARYVSVFFTDSYLVLGEPRLVRRTITDGDEIYTSLGPRNRVKVLRPVATCLYCLYSAKLRLQCG